MRGDLAEAKPSLRIHFCGGLAPNIHPLLQTEAVEVIQVEDPRFESAAVRRGLMDQGVRSMNGGQGRKKCLGSVSGPVMESDRFNDGYGQSPQAQ